VLIYRIQRLRRFRHDHAPFWTRGVVFAWDPRPGGTAEEPKVLIRSPPVTEPLGQQPVYRLCYQKVLSSLRRWARGWNWPLRPVVVIRILELHRHGFAPGDRDFLEHLRQRVGFEYWKIATLLALSLSPAWRWSQPNTYCS
jgi:hypothetical protein